MSWNRESQKVTEDYRRNGESNSMTVMMEASIITCNIEIVDVTQQSWCYL